MSNATGRKRVVVTGMSTINPLGDTLDGYYASLVQGRSGLKQWATLDLNGQECRIGGDLGDYDVAAALDRLPLEVSPAWRKRINRLFRSTTFSNKLAVLCALRAYLDAGLAGLAMDPGRLAVILAGHNFNSKYIHRNIDQFRTAPLFMDPTYAVDGLDTNIAASVSEILGAQGPTYTVGGACASGNLALRNGFWEIRNGECAAAVVAGAPFDISAVDMAAMVFIQSVVVQPEFQDQPQLASRPFDKRRCGFIPSHGTGALVLEELEAARARGARIYAEIAGLKANAQADHLPSPSAASQGRLMQELLQDSGVAPEQVDYINCHATSTPLGDLEEIRAIKQVFGSHACRLKLNAPKSMLGHTCWAAPLVETIGGILQMNHGRLHPSINIDELEPEIDLDVCANQARACEVNYMLKNSFGFGGLNCCALVKKYEV